MWKRCTYLVLLIGILAPLCGSSAYGAFDPLKEPSLIAWWKCDEGQGNTVADAGPGKHDGTFRDGTGGWAEGISGSAIRLVGPTIVEVPAVAGLKLTQATIAGWFLPNGSQADWGAMIMHRGSGLAHGFNFLASGQLAYHWNDDAVSWNYRGTAYYSTTDWTHCALTVEPTKATFYVNGVAICSNVATHPQTTWDNPIHLGGDLNSAFAGRQINGSLDEVLFFSRALTAAEVKALVTPRPKARGPSPANGAIGVQMPLLQWTVGEGAIFHDIYVGTSPDLTEANKVGNHQAWAMYYFMTPLTPGVTYYWRIDEVDATGNIAKGDVWSFTTEPTQAYSPQPADGSKDLLPGQTLKWRSPAMTMKHQVYFSSVQSEVADGTAAADKGQVTDAAFNTGVLRSSTTYFWRIDEVRGTGTEKGKVWSFSTADGVSKKIARQYWTSIGGGTIPDLTNNAAYPANPTGTEFLDSWQGPTDSIDNYGDRCYGWLTPPETGDYNFWIASDDASQLWLSTDADPANATMIASVATYTAAQAWTANASQASAAIPLKAGQKYFIMSLHKEGGGGDNLAVAWKGPNIAQQVIKAEFVDTFAQPALQAYSPRPLNGAVDASFDGSLSWNAGEKAQKHDVYFGEDKEAVAAADTTSPLYKGQQSGTSFEAGSLEWGKTYYWRVDEINPAEADSPWKGNVWSFTTANFILVDDMESYNDDDNRIYDAWLDNFGDDSGSTVGNDPAPFAEQAIVHGGKQSLPMAYNNAGSKHFFSETVRTFDTAQNWTINDVNALSLWVRGYPALTPVTVTESGGKMSLTGGGTDIWNNSDDFTFAYKTLSGDGSIVARVTNIGTGTNGWAKGGVMIRASLNGGSPFTDMVITGAATSGNGASFQYRLATDGACAASDATAAVNPPYWVKLTRQGDNLSAFISANGTSWTVMGNPQTIAMTGPVYLGICVTSHAAGEQRTFQFENITTTGSVSGSWQGAQINAARFNAVAPLYVVVEDSSAKSAVVSDPALVNASAWTQWKIPLTSFTGVNLSKVKKMYLGVGDRKSTTPGGTGRIFLDDIRVTRP